MEGLVAAVGDAERVADRRAGRGSVGNAGLDDRDAGLERKHHRVTVAVVDGHTRRGCPRGGGLVDDGARVDIGLRDRVRRRGRHRLSRRQSLRRPRPGGDGDRTESGQRVGDDDVVESHVARVGHREGICHDITGLIDSGGGMRLLDDECRSRRERHRRPIAVGHGRTCRRVSGGGRGVDDASTVDIGLREGVGRGSRHCLARRESVRGTEPVVRDGGQTCQRVAHTDTREGDVSGVLNDECVRDGRAGTVARGRGGRLGHRDRRGRREFDGRVVGAGRGRPGGRPPSRRCGVHDRPGIEVGLGERIARGARDRLARGEDAGCAGPRTGRDGDRSGPEQRVVQVYARQRDVAGVRDHEGVLDLVARDRAVDERSRLVQLDARCRLKRNVHVIDALDLDVGGRGPRRGRRVRGVARVDIRLGQRVGRGAADRLPGREHSLCTRPTGERDGRQPRLRVGHGDAVEGDVSGVRHIEGVRDLIARLRRATLHA